MLSLTAGMYQHPDNGSGYENKMPRKRKRPAQGQPHLHVKPLIRLNQLS
jgi:hypothetical protein